VIKKKEKKRMYCIKMWREASWKAIESNNDCKWCKK
jgi:hypothetical protein